MKNLDLFSDGYFMKRINDLLSRWNKSLEAGRGYFD